MKLSLVPPRSYQPEILDSPGNRYEDLAPALRDIARVNRWLGGSAAVVRPIVRSLRRLNLREFSLLDVGTGGADVPLAVVASAARRGIRVRAVGVDSDPNVVLFAARTVSEHLRHGPLPVRPGIAGQRTTRPHGEALAGEGFAPLLVRADAFSLPFADSAFDFVACSLFLHHFREEDAARLLAEFARVARRFVVVNDLARHLVPWAAIRFLGALFAESPMFRNDAPLSVLRGWTAAELLEIAAHAGLSAASRVVRLPPYRLVLLVEKNLA